MLGWLRHRSAVFVVVLLLLQLNSQSALGSEGASAQALFDAGRSAMARSDYRQACSAFQESQRLEPAVGTLLNLATCQVKLRHLTSAWRLFKEAADKLPAEDERMEFVRGRIIALEAQLPQVNYEVNPLPADLQIEDDGVILLRASLGTPLPVDPGKHEVHVRAAGHSTWTTSYSIAEGEQKTIHLQVGPRLNLAPKAPQEPESSAQETAGYWLLGLGTAGLVTAGVTGVLAANAKGTYDNHCSNEICDARGESAAKRGKTLVLINAVVWAATIASAATGGLLLLSAPRESDNRHSAWHLVPTDAGTGMGVGVETVF